MPPFNFFMIRNFYRDLNLKYYVEKICSLIKGKTFIRMFSITFICYKEIVFFINFFLYKQFTVFIFYERNWKNPLIFKLDTLYYS